MSLRLVTLGGLAAAADGSELSAFGSQRLRAALLVYLAVERAATRDALQALLWPENDGDNTSSRLKQTVYAIRRSLGEDCIETAGQELRAGPRLQADASEFELASEAGRYDEAMRLYQGPFLAGVYLVESNAYETWTDSTRSKYARQFRKACRTVVDARVAAGDLAGALAAAQTWVAPDSLDDEAQHRLIELLARHSGRTEALKQYENYAKLLQVDDLQPLDQTRELVAAIEAQTDATLWAGPPLPPIQPRPEPGYEAPAKAIQTTPHRPRWKVAAASIASAALMGTVAWKIAGSFLGLNAAADAKSLDENLYLVLPFAAATPGDTALERLGSDMAAMVSANLDGLGDLRTVDRLTALARAGNSRKPITHVEAEAFARELRAARLIVGTVARLPEGVRLDIQILPTSGGRPVAHADVAASKDNLHALADSATRELLPRIWRAGTEPSPSFEGALRTSSLDALRTFLEGERALTEDRWHDAVSSFRNSFATDSSFWLAAWRQQQVQSFIDPRGIDSVLLANVRAHQFALTPLERLLLSAMNDTLSVAFNRLNEAARTIGKNSWLTQYTRGEMLMHYGPFQGSSELDARNAFESALELNPHLIPAQFHRFLLASSDRDSAATRDFVGLLPTLGPGALAEYRCNGCDYPLQIRYLDGLVRTNGRGDPALLDTAVHNAALTSWGRISNPILFGYNAAAIDAFNATLRAGVSNEGAVGWLRWQIAVAWAARGAWDSAFIALEQFRSTWSGGNAALFAYGLAVTANWHDLLDAKPIAKWRPGALQEAKSFGAYGTAEIAWLDAIAAAKRNDLTAFKEANARLKAAGDPYAHVLERSLEVFDRRLTRRDPAAGKDLAALVWAEAEHAPSSTIHPWATPIMRSAAAAWLADERNTQSALDLLAWHEAWWVGLREYTEWLAGPLYLTRARLEEARGNTAMARRNYVRFLQRYDSPAPTLTPLVTEARQALDRIGSPKVRAAQGNR